MTGFGLYPISSLVDKVSSPETRAAIAHWWNEPVGYRDTMLPIVESANDGHLMPGVPRLLYDPYQALLRSIMAGGDPKARTDAGPIMGPLDGLTIAGAMPLGTMALGTSAGAIERGAMGARPTRGTFGGYGRAAEKGALDLEPVEVGSRFGETPKADISQSRNWPHGWDLSSPEKIRDAELFTRFADAEDAWNNIVNAIQFPNGARAMDRWQAEKIAMDTHGDLGLKWQDAKEAFREGRAGRPLTPSERAWDDLDRPPGSQPLSNDEMMRQIVVPNVIMPDGSMPGAVARNVPQVNSTAGAIERGAIERGELGTGPVRAAANPDTSAAAPLAISGQPSMDSQNAPARPYWMMPSADAARMSKILRGR